MSITCPQCHSLRPAPATAPAGPCPSCGEAYAQSARAGGSTGGIAWGKWLMLAAFLYAAWAGVQVASQAGTADLSVAEIKTLAATVKPGEVVMFGTDRCAYCVQAKGWLSQYGFAFTECNLDASAACERAFRKLGGEATPFLMVRGQPMKHGFKSNEFLTLLRAKS